MSECDCTNCEFDDDEIDLGWQVGAFMRQIISMQKKYIECIKKFDNGMKKEMKEDEDFYNKNMQFNPCHIAIYMKEEYGDENVGLIQYPCYKMLGAFIVIIFETFEQQLLSLGINISSVYNRKKYGFKYYRILKNVIKHGKGNAFNDLQKMKTSFLVKNENYYTNEIYTHVHYCYNEQEVILNYSMNDINILCDKILDFYAEKYKPISPLFC